MSINVEGTLADRVSAALAQLSPAEARVAQYLAAMPAERLIFTNASQLGQQTRSSDATVVRTARKLGYSGLPQLKREAGNQLGEPTSPAERLTQKIATLGSDLGSLRARIFDDAIESLELTRETIDDAALQSAVAVLARAQAIFAFGYGGSELGARHLARTVSRMGYDARAVTDTGLMLADSLSQLAHGDAAVIFQPGRELRDVEVELEHAASVGAQTILISGSRLGERLEGAYEVGLIAIRGSAQLSAEALSSVVVADLLAYGLSTLDEARAVRARQRLTHLRNRLVG